MMEGLLLSGRYRLLEMIDTGGSAYIYKAMDTKNNTVVAAKVLKPELAANPAAVERFKKEAQVALRLKHANIIPAHDSGVDGNHYYIIMDFINGKTLKHIITINEPLPVKFVVNAAKKLSLALEYAHVKGFIHRDIKPHNIIIDMDGEPYIADFGIAEKITPGTNTIEEENVMGSVHYFSPEQARGEKVDKRSDIYSLGIVLYETLTGKVPFDGETSVEIALQHLNQQMPDIVDKSRDVPPSLNKIVQKATQKDKNLRYKSAFAMYEDLNRCLAEKDGNYIKLQKIENVSFRSVLPKKPPIGNKTILFGALGILVFIIVLLVVFNLNFGKSIQNVAVPNIVNQTQQTATDEVVALNLVPSVINDFSTSVVSGVVISQDPEAGKEVKEGQTVTIHVSVGPDLTHMLNLVGMSLQDAEDYLKKQNITDIVIIDQTEGNYPDGTVISQVPAENDTITSSDKVTLTVKTSPNALSVKSPGVIGSTLSQALDSLKSLGFTNFYVYEEQSDKSPGTVDNQNPAQGISQAVDQPFTMWVSEYGNIYSVSSTLNLNIEDDNSIVNIALKTQVNGTDVYFILKESQMDAGDNQRLDLSTERGLPTDESSVKAQIVVFINGLAAQTTDVTLQSGG